MKDNRKAQYISEMVKIVKQYGDTQQLRTHVGKLMLRCMDEHERDIRKLCKRSASHDRANNCPMNNKQ